MIRIRNYYEDDSLAVGRLIADTYRRYNLDFIQPNEQAPFLGPFQHAYSSNPEHKTAISHTIHAEIIYIAENYGNGILGVLRGKPERLHSLFVGGNYHRMGIGSALLNHFEMENRDLGYKVIRLASTLYAVPFYLRMGYKKSTGVRKGWSFQGEGLQWQPMKKVLDPISLPN
jgi:GNAT superfamily N-acetyltransferase